MFRVWDSTEFSSSQFVFRLEVAARKTVAIPPMRAHKRIRRNLTVIEINLLEAPCSSPKEEERRKYPWKG